MDGKNGKYLLACAEALFWKKKETNNREKSNYLIE
jgi:hypothetical protein